VLVGELRADLQSAEQDAETAATVIDHRKVRLAIPIEIADGQAIWIETRLLARSRLEGAIAVAQTEWPVSSFLVETSTDSSESQPDLNQLLTGSIFLYPYASDILALARV